MKYSTFINFSLIVYSFAIIFSGCSTNKPVATKAPQKVIVKIQKPKVAAPTITLQLAMDAYNRKNYNTAFNYFTTLANQKNPVAQTYLGVMYYWGYGVSKNDTRAAYWYSQAAYQNNKQAQYALGSMYQHGEGVKKDNKEAFKWFSRAALQNHCGAQSCLGYMYTFGEGVNCNYEKAIDWYVKAIKNGDKKAKCDVVEPLLASDSSIETKRKAKKILSKAYSQTKDMHCKVIYDRYKLFQY